MRGYRKNFYFNAFEKDTVLVWKTNIVFKYLSLYHNTALPFAKEASTAMQVLPVR